MTEEAERRLAQARARAESLAGGDLDDLDALRAAHDEVIAAEREVARLRGEQYAVELTDVAEWDIGAPLPHVLAANGTVILVYYLRTQPDPDWDGTWTRLVDPAAPDAVPLAVVEFESVHSVRFGGPNDEAIEGHPLHGRGLEPYAAHKVINSHWIAEAEQINSVHPFHRGGWHVRLHHYVFCFHDDTFECLAEAFRVERVHCSLGEALSRAGEQLVLRL